MNTPLLKILLVEDDEDDYLIVREILSKTKGTRFELVWAPTYEEGLGQIERNAFAAILIDYSLGQKTGLEFIRETTARDSEIPFIFLTGLDNYEIDLQAMQAGAAEFLTKKDINAPLLERSIRYAIERKQTELILRQDAVRAEILANMTLDFTESSLNYIATINKIARRISETFGDGIIVRILAEDGQTLEPAAIDHPDPQARERMVDLVSTTTQHVGEGIVGEVAINKAPRLVSYASSEEMARLTKPEYFSWFKQFPVDSVFIAPLYSHSRLIGTLTVVRNTPAGQILPSDQSFYLDLANRAAMAIENAKLHMEVEHLALTDSLTGLFNRRGFAQLAQREIERTQRYGSPLSVIMLDIDHFKTVNDTYGHVSGDEVLKALARSCTLNIRKMDIASRYGGDEFVIMLPETNLPLAQKVANRIRKCFAKQTFFPKDDQVHLTISIGITKATEETKDLDMLIQKADTALYQSKQKGRNRIEVL
jgi:diguanylate cyclase (GGDEF)-like protein